jgi:hypothetical protein
MIKIDTRTAAQHRLARHTRIVVAICISVAAGIAGYFALWAML